MEAYIPLAQNLAFGFSMVVRTVGDPARLEGPVRSVFASVDRNLPIYEVVALENYLSGTLAQRKFTLALLMSFCLLALVLAAVGIYGVISYTVSLRAREVGIRMAIGAQPGQVARMVLFEGLALTAGGLMLGFVASLAVTRVLGTMLYDVHPVDPPTLVSVALALACVAAAATIAPARRASHADPIATLRQD
jgi:putative ABC transport system permease protein